MLNVKNIERNESLRIGSDKEGHELKMRCDKLTVVLPLSKGMAKAEVMYSLLLEMSEGKYKTYDIQCKYLNKKEVKQKHYYAALIIRRKSDGKMLLRIDFKPFNKRTGAVRLDFRPQHMSAEQLDKMLSWLDCKLGNGLFPLLRKSWVTKVDVALDVYGCHLHDYEWRLKSAFRYDFFDKKSGLPGKRLGSKRSPLCVLCYEKHDATGDLLSKCLHQPDGSMDMVLNESSDFLRVEAKIRPGGRPGSKKHDCLMLRGLGMLDYPFERLIIYPVNIERIKAGTYGQAVDAGRGTKTHIKRSSSMSPDTYWKSRKGRENLERFRVKLFDKNHVWSFWPECVQRLGRILGGSGE
ncbi:hypothetical protein [Mangrovibacter sp. MFB070]|uniref:hypothetical protein n=1 Tax=Mangrovibacter sp. MFB070 TaxID=1224318 RepID=UPI00068E67EA|nr:hypothetical protein [Mangrovibacter sp. MFB070]